MKNFIKAFLIVLFIPIVIIGFIFLATYTRADTSVSHFNANYRDPSLSGPIDEGMKAAYAHDYKTAMKLWKPLAEKGNAASQNNVGVLYENGLGVPRDYAEALKWYRKAANQGDMHAEWMMGTMNSGGPIGGKCNPSEAEKWFGKAAEQGDRRLQASLGGIYERGGTGYEQKDCIKKDYTKALQWYLKSAKQNDAGAEMALAKMYGLGEGVKRNEVESAKWVRKAADQGWNISQMSLGDLYYNGKGVPQSYAEAYFWYKIGEKNGALSGARADEAQSFWDEKAFEKLLTSEQIKTIDKRVDEWKPIPAIGNKGNN